MASAKNGVSADAGANYDTEILSVCIVFSVLSLLFIVARLASRRIKRVRLEVDDWILILAWVNTTRIRAPNQDVDCRRVIAIAETGTIAWGIL